MTETWTILKLLRWMTDYFAERGIESARLDAELLMAHALDLARVQLYTQFDRPLNTEELKKVRELVKRRAAREPLAYILGRKEFYSLEFIVNPAVLIPRPETEILVETGIEIFRSQNPPSPPFSKGGEDGSPPLKKGGEGGFKIFDIGTGSGCIAIALAKHLPQAEVWAVDASKEALEIAEINVNKHQVADRVHSKLWDLRKDPWKGPPERFDLIVSNPPYVPSGQMTTLSPEISYEPPSALEAGSEGLDNYPFLFSFTSRHLEPGGCLLVEMGSDQSEKVIGLGKRAGFENFQLIHDLAGLPRVIKIY